MSRLFAIILFISAMAALYFSVINYAGQPHKSNNIKIDGVYLPQPTQITDFTLTDNHGKPFSKENMKGHWTMLFFGFTNCGMVCPATMAALNNMYKILQKDLPKDQLPQVVLISVDPDRDTVARLNDYVNAFNPSFTGARGDMNMTQALEKQLHIVAEKMQADGAGKNHYTINHSAEIMLFNPNVQLQAFLSYPHQAEQMAKDYKLIIGGV